MRMEFFFLLPLLAILSGNAAGVDFNFFLNRDMPLQLHKAAQRSQTLNFSGSGNWSITVLPGGHSLAELLFPKTTLLPAGKILVAELEFSTKNPEEIANILLRVVDAGGETHSIPATCTGNRAVWQLEPGMKTQNSWGRGVNRKLDFPLKGSGIAVVFRGKGCREIQLGSFSVSDLAQRHLVPSAKTLRKFTPYAPHRFTGNPIRQEMTREGLRLSFSAAGCSRINEWGIPTKENPEHLKAILLQGKLLHGNARFRVCCLDPKNRKWVKSEFLPFPPQGKELRLPLQEAGALQFREIEIEAKAGTELLLERILAEQPRLYPDVLEVEVETGRSARLVLLTPESRKSFALRLTNRSGKSLKLIGEFLFRNLYGNERIFRKEIRLGPGETEQWKPFELSDRNQIWKLEYRLTAPDKTCVSGSIFFGLLTPSGTDLPPNPGFRFGVCNHWIDPDAVEAMRFCGIRSIRCTTAWLEIQPSPDKWDFRLLDEKLALLAGSGIRLRSTLAYTPPWAALPPTKNRRESRNRLPSPSAWHTYVETLVKRYGKLIEFYEVWNEPDLRGFADFPAEKFAELQCSAFKIIKSISPELPVASGGFATVRPEHESGKTLKFHEKTLELARKSFDIHSYHEHGSFGNYPYLLDHIFLPMRRKYGITQPWIASETAIHSANGNEVLQAETLFKKLFFSWSRGAVGYTWYNLINSGNNPKYGEHNFGMLTRGLEPKFVYGIYNMITRTYREATFLRQLTAEEPYQFLFRTPKELLLACWNHSGKEGSRIFFLESDAAGAERIDLFGNRTSAAHIGGGTFYEIGRFGSTLALKSATKTGMPRLVAELVLPPNRIPGNAVSMSLRLTNPGKEPQRLQLVPESAIRQLPAEVTLHGGETRELPVALVDSPVAELIAAIKIVGNGWPEPLRVSGVIRQARVIPPGRINVNRKPDFQLKSYSDLVTPWENDPATAHLIWRDAWDLSAQIWLGSDGTNFLLRVNVEDDLHAPACSPERIWNGDSVQFALAFSGQNGYFELGAAENGGKPRTGVWQVPAGFLPETVHRMIQTDIRRSGTKTVYQFQIPWQAFGADAKLRAQGVHFNLIVNDNDGEQRKGWLQVAPGLGINQTMMHSPVLLFR